MQSHDLLANGLWKNAYHYKRLCWIQVSASYVFSIILFQLGCRGYFRVLKLLIKVEPIIMFTLHSCWDLRKNGKPRFTGSTKPTPITDIVSVDPTIKPQQGPYGDWWMQEKDLDVQERFIIMLIKGFRFQYLAMCRRRGIDSMSWPLIIPNILELFYF